MSIKVMEISYDIGGIHGCDPMSALDPRALRFRDAACHLVETALELAGLGSVLGFDSRPGEVSFRFAVRDFDAAEREVRGAVAGTAFAGISAITRSQEAVAA